MQDPGGELPRSRLSSNRTVLKTNSFSQIKSGRGLRREPVVGPRRRVAPAQAGLGAKKASTSVIVLVMRYGGRDWRNI
jgi:hypothetical protein